MEIKDNEFVLFVNDNKTNEKQPDFTGKINIGGVMARISAWTRESKAGNKFLSGKVTVDRAQDTESQSQVPW